MDECVVHNVAYYQKKGYVSVGDGDAFRVIEDIALTFGVPLEGPGGIKRGFNWLGGATHPRHPELFLWWPAPGETTGGWVNEFLGGDCVCLEYNKDHERSRIHVRDVIADGRTRATFKKEEHSRYGWCYRFLGVFRLDPEESERICKAVWEQDSDLDRLQI